MQLSDDWKLPLQSPAACRLIRLVVIATLVLMPDKCELLKAVVARRLVWTAFATCQKLRSLEAWSITLWECIGHHHTFPSMHVWSVTRTFRHAQKLFIQFRFTFVVTDKPSFLIIIR